MDKLFKQIICVIYFIKIDYVLVLKWLVNQYETMC